MTTLTKWKAFGWAFLVFVGALISWALASLFNKAPHEPAPGTAVMLPALQARADAAAEASLVEQVQAHATAEAHHDELARVMRVDDGVDRRRQLAALLRGLK